MTPRRHRHILLILTLTSAGILTLISTASFHWPLILALASSPPQLSATARSLELRAASGHLILVYNSSRWRGDATELNKLTNTTTRYPSGLTFEAQHSPSKLLPLLSRTPMYHHLAGLGFGHWQEEVAQTSYGAGEPKAFESTQQLILTFHSLYPLTLLLAYPLLRLYRLLQSHRAPLPHQCPHCRYDLRATQDPSGPLLPICPECGGKTINPPPSTEQPFPTSHTSPHKPQG